MPGKNYEIAESTENNSNCSRYAVVKKHEPQDVGFFLFLPPVYVAPPA